MNENLLTKIMLFSGPFHGWRADQVDIVNDTGAAEYIFIQLPDFADVQAVYCETDARIYSFSHYKTVEK